MEHAGHGGGGGGMGNSNFSTVNTELARRFWYIVAGFVGAFLLIRIVNWYKDHSRIRRRASNSVEFPTKPSNKFLETWATLTAVVREASYPQLYVPFKGISWLTPPPLGRVIALLVYWIVVIYMMTEGAIINDAFFWERIGYRNGWITVTQVPLLYLLSSNHEKLNWLHRWVARTMLVSGAVHGWHFYADWARSGLVDYQINLLPIIKYGFGAWGVLLWACVSGLAPLRRMSYEFFVLQHIVTAVVFIWLVYMHVPADARYNVWVCRTALLLWQNIKVFPDKAKCNGGQKVGHQAQVRAVGDSITVVTIKDVHFKWRAGQHLYLWMPRVGIAEAHPYTIACARQLPETCICNSIQLVVRKQKGFSKRLHEFASKSQAEGKKDRLTVFVSGPFGAPPRWDVYETIILISASTGTSFTLPILESVIQSKQTNCVKRIDLLLTTKQGEEIDFYVTRVHQLIDQAKNTGVELNVHIAVTQGPTTFTDGHTTNTKIKTVGISSASSSGSNLAPRQQLKEQVQVARTPSPLAVDIEQAALAVPVERKRTSNVITDSHFFYSSVRPDIETFIRGPVEATGVTPISSKQRKGTSTTFKANPSISINSGRVVTSPFLQLLRQRSIYPPAMTSQLEQLVQKVEGLSLDAFADKYPNCHPEVNPFDLYRAHLSSVLGEVTGVDTKIIYPALAWTASLDKGDLVLPAPALRIKGKKPDELAAEWGAKFPEDDILFEKPTVSGYFMTFFLKPEPLTKALLPLIRSQGRDFGRNKYHGLKDPKDPSKGKKRMIVEFSSPNIAKPFHAGHLRSTIIGGFLANLYDIAGWDVTRINYLGDWGKQYGLLALGFEKYGDEETLEQDPINHLFQLYVRINTEMSAEKEEFEKRKQAGEDISELEANSLDEQARRYFRKMTDRDPDALAMWRRFRDLSIVRYQQTYARLNIHFDEYSGESQVSEEEMEKIGKEMEEKGIAKEDKGAMIVDFQELIPGKEGKRLEKPIVRKRDGTALYLTRDISELLNRHKKYDFDHMIYVVASAQDLHLKQLFKIIELLGHKDIAAKCQHINFGLVLGMSTRKGTVKFLDDILRDVADKMHETMRKNETKYSQVENPEATADVLGISSVMVQDMTGKRINNYTFNMDQMTSFEGDTGPYLQYAHARIASIKRRADIPDEEVDTADLSLLTEPHAVNIVRLLVQWPDVIANTLRTLEPVTVLAYLFKMTHALSSSYDHLKIVGSERELMKARLALYDAAHVVLGNGMRLLGLSPVDR
ncbi:arginyl-tRNA synthetase [Podospora fimiseda]|uniref:arginine--tRNA ligase n=1 Tax=Podospora fimiseda TaxID=252190 RepID=A0AAN7BKS8_9PEZI|nr:arginyl-tRNA synthetase [Podospora fimiseda]